MTFEMKCDCGKTVTVEAGDREEAVRKVKEIMNEVAIKKHMATEHPGQPLPTIKQAHANIEQNLKQVS
jgi:hypothetical protein